MRAAPFSIGDHPQSTPDESYPCAACIGEAARQAVHDAIYDLKHGDAFPSDKGDATDFEDEFCKQICAMGEWCCDRAAANIRHGDHEPCERHAPTKSDEE